MNSKKISIFSVVILLAIFGFTTAAKQLNKTTNQTKIATTVLNNENAESTTLNIATPSDELKEKFDTKQAAFNTLATLLKDEYENTILEANADEYKDFVISKKANELLTQLDIVYVGVNVSISQVKNKVVVFTLGKTWATNANTSVVNTTQTIPTATAITTNWYSLN